MNISGIAEDDAGAPRDGETMGTSSRGNRSLPTAGGEGAVTGDAANDGLAAPNRNG
jgi:hypothetical protein